MAETVLTTADRVSVHALLAEHADRRGGSDALVGDDRTVSYAELFSRVVGTAEWLVEAGLSPNSLAAVSMRDEPTHLISAMALLCLGSPQITLPSHETAESKRAIAAKLSVGQIVTDRPEPWMDGLVIIPPPKADRLASGNRAKVCREGFSADQNVVYRKTSGSTKVPRVFGVSMERLLFMARRQANDTSQRRVLRTTSVEYDSSRFNRISSLIAGNACVLAHRIDLATLGGLCERASVTSVHIGPYKLASLLSARAQVTQRLPPAAQLQVGGARVSPLLRQAIRRVLTENLWIPYATSEAGPISMAGPGEHDEFPDGVGFPLTDVEAEIVDAEGRALPPGMVGQIRVRSHGAPRGYIGETSPASPFRDGWFYPGDLLAWPERSPLIFHGRADDLMILNGINIFSAAIEDVLESHPDVSEAVAFPVRSRIHGEVPVAAVVLTSNARNRDPLELMDYCRRKLGIRGPRQIRIVESIPRNAVGKPLRRELGAGPDAA